MKINIKGVAAYLFLLIIAVLFMLYLDGPGGGYLLIALIAAAVVSVALCIYTRQTLTLTSSVSSDVLNRGDIAAVTVKIGRKGFIPTAFISAEVYSSYHFLSDGDKAIRTAIFGREKFVKTFYFRASFFGKGKIGVSSIMISDYLGLVTFRMNIAGNVTDMKIYPDIPEVNGRDGLARSLTDAAAFDDSEETTASTFSLGGTPGYEHRKYEPGDNLKLINWKLSAKRGELLVRMLEGALGSEQVFILDRAVSPEKNDTEAREAEQLVVEGLLGLMSRFAVSELPVKLMIRFNDLWETVAVTNLGELSDLRYRFTDYTFVRDSGGRFPECDNDRAVVFSACCDERFIGYLDKKLSSSGVTDKIRIPSDKLWKAERDNDDIVFTK